MATSRRHERAHLICGARHRSGLAAARADSGPRAFGRIDRSAADFGWSNGGTRTTIRWPASTAGEQTRTLMVEPDSAEPIWKTRAACRGVVAWPGVVELGDIGGEGRIYRAGARSSTRRGGRATLA